MVNFLLRDFFCEVYVFNFLMIFFFWVVMLYDLEEDVFGWDVFKLFILNICLKNKI